MRPHFSAALTIAAALAAGALIAYVDTRPHWDDTGVTAGLLLLSALTLAFARPRLWIAIALAVGVWIPLVEISQSHNAGSLIALAIAFIGALCGLGIRSLIEPPAPHATR